MKTIQFFPFQLSGKTHSTCNINAFLQSSSNIRLTTKTITVQLLSLSFYQIYYITNSNTDSDSKAINSFKAYAHPQNATMAICFFSWKKKRFAWKIICFCPMLHKLAGFHPLLLKPGLNVEVSNPPRVVKFYSRCCSVWKCCWSLCVK